MAKKQYLIKTDGNIKDALRTGKIKFSCVSSNMDPFDKTVRITQAKATRDHYCRPAFYEDLENIPAGGKDIKMSLIWNNVDFKVDLPNWISMTKISSPDELSPIQYWLNISPNIGLSRYGKIKISYEYGGLPYSETYNVTQYGKDISSNVGKITCSPSHLQSVDYTETVIPIEVTYEGIRKIRDPFFSPYDMPWISVQKLDEYKSTNKIIVTYNIVIKQNDEPDPRIVNAMFGGIADNNKEVTVNCNIMQAGNPEDTDYPAEEQK